MPRVGEIGSSMAWARDKADGWAMARGGGGVIAPVGQALFFVSQAFVVPEAVTLLKAVVIGAGGDYVDDALGDGTAYAAGGGGGLTWDNAIAVTPLETLQIICEDPANGVDFGIKRGAVWLIRATSALGFGGGLTVGAATATHGGGNGSGGQSVLRTDGSNIHGGGAGGYTGNGFTLGSSFGATLGGYGSSPTSNVAVAPTTVNGQSFGGGAGISYGVTGVRSGGCVRAMWGPDRFYPANQTADL